MKVALLGPVASADLVPLVGAAARSLPVGYAGAPLMATLIGALLDRGHQVTAITTDPSLPVDAPAVRWETGALTVTFVGQRPRAFTPAGGHVGRAADLFRLERRALVAEARRAEPDVVHAHWAYEFGWAALTTGLPHVITCHDAPLVIARYARTAYRWVRAAMAWHVLKRARTVTAVSPYMRDRVQPWCRAQVAVVPNPVSVRLPPGHRPRSDRGTSVAMICNGWGARKNPQAAIRGFALARAQVPAAELHLYGQDFGPGQAAAQWCAGQGLGAGVHFHGSLRHDELMQALAAGDLLLHSALEESFGLVLAEALACGLAVVAGRSSGAVPWVVGEGGRLVDITDPQAIAAAITELLTHPEIRHRLAQQGKARVDREFAPAVVAQAYEALYQQAMAQCRQS